MSAPYVAGKVKHSVVPSSSEDSTQIEPQRILDHALFREYQQVAYGFLDAETAPVRESEVEHGTEADEDERDTQCRHDNQDPKDQVHDPGDVAQPLVAELGRGQQVSPPTNVGTATSSPPRAAESMYTRHSSWIRCLTVPTPLPALRRIRGGGGANGRTSLLGRLRTQPVLTRRMGRHKPWRRSRPYGGYGAKLGWRV